MTEYNRDLYLSILDNEPKKVYRKSITGKVAVKTLDPFDVESGKVLEVVLEGDVKSNTAKVYLFSDKEVAFFERVNRKLIDSGIVVEDVKKGDVEKSQDGEKFLDEDIEEILMGRHHKKFESFIKNYIDRAPEEEKRARLARVVRIAKSLDVRSSRLEVLKVKMIEYGLGGIEL